MKQEENEFKQKPFTINKPVVDSEFSKIPNQIFYLSDLTYKEKFVLVYLFSNSSNYHIWYTIASKQLGIDRKYFSKHIQRLHELGYITLNKKDKYITINLEKIVTNGNTAMKKKVIPETKTTTEQEVILEPEVSKTFETISTKTILDALQPNTDFSKSIPQISKTNTNNTTIDIPEPEVIPEPIEVKIPLPENGKLEPSDFQKVEPEPEVIPEPETTTKPMKTYFNKDIFKHVSENPQVLDIYQHNAGIKNMIQEAVKLTNVAFIASDKFNWLKQHINEDTIDTELKLLVRNNPTPAEQINNYVSDQE